MNSARTRRFGLAVTAALASILLAGSSPTTVWAQTQTAAAEAGDTTSAAPQPLSADELEVLVARVALYPDELVAVISGASLYPLQVVEAARFLDNYAKDKSLKPKESWDGSVISLLNYPEVVKMMSDDLEWTQTFGDAIAYQQKDVLIAIQQLREEAVAKGIIKSDDKMKVTTENDNVVIQSASTETVYVPRYEPAMLYEPDYAPVPIAYYPDPYPSYWYPTATFFAGAVTGAVWAAAVDWDDWNVWGGRWNGGNIDVDCNKCFNNIDFNGKINFNDIDWKNVDRSKLKFDKNQFANLEHNDIRNSIKLNSDNSLRARAGDIKRDNNLAIDRPGKAARVQDIRKSTLDGLKQGPAGDIANKRPDIKAPAAVKRDTAGSNIKKPDRIDRPVGKPKVADKIDNRPRQPSGLGNIDRGKAAKIQSNRGQKAMGGGQRGGGRAVGGGGGGGRQMHRGGGGGGRRR